MARKTAKQHSNDLEAEKIYRWDILRSSKEYRKDIEEWSGRKYKDWGMDEKVVNFPFQLPNLSSLEDLEDYEFNYCFTVAQVGLSPEEVKEYEAYFTPRDPDVIIKEIGSWYKWRKKWSIPVPYNPKLKECPFKSKGIRREPAAITLIPKEHMFGNLADEEKYLNLSLNLDFPKSVILEQCKMILSAALDLRKCKGIKEKRFRKDKWPEYKEIHKLMNQKEATQETVMEHIFGEFPENEDSAKVKISRHYIRAKKNSKNHLRQSP